MRLLLLCWPLVALSSTHREWTARYWARPCGSPSREPLRQESPGRSGPCPHPPPTPGCARMPLPEAARSDFPNSSPPDSPPSDPWMLLRVQPEIQRGRSEEHTSELQSPCNLVCRLLLEKKKK